MTTFTSQFFSALAMAMAIGLTGTSPASAQACLDNRQIQEAVSAGEIMSLVDVLALAGVDTSAEILSVQVCDESGALVYVIGVLTPEGEAQNLVLGAQ